MKKLIIYLDQNFISNIAKLKNSTKDSALNQKLKQVFQVIKDGVDEEKFVVPDSFIQHIETAKIENNLELIDLIYDHLKYLGQVTFLQPWEIADREFYSALGAYYGKRTEDEDREPWKEAFNENPDKRMKNFDITVKMPNIDLNLNTTEKLQEIRNTHPEYIEQYLKELEAARVDYRSKLHAEYAHALRCLGISIEEAEKFINSDAFAEIPYINIHCRLWAKNISKDGKRQVGEGDFNDIQMLSAYLPYCDILTTEKYMKSLVESLGFDKKYKCAIFSMRSDQLDDLISSLKKEMDRPPANESLFSVVGYSEDGISIYSFDFLERLVTARSKFENTGKYWNKEMYVPVYLISNEELDKMPDRDAILKNGTSVLDQNQRKQLYMFIHGIERLSNRSNESVELLVRKIPTHLAGKGIALLEKLIPFDKEPVEHDSDLFYDIETAIERHVELTEKYKIRIVYP